MKKKNNKKETKKFEVAKFEVAKLKDLRVIKGGQAPDDPVDGTGHRRVSQGRC